MVCQAAFWTSLALLAYTFLGYQWLIGILSRFRRPPAQPPPGPPPRATVVIVASNEAARIRSRVLNLLDTSAAVDILVCSDGSSDSTPSEARLAGARVIEFPLRRGKASCLSDVIPTLDSPLVVLTDSRQQFTPDTIPRLLRHFAHPAVGAVSGILRISDSITPTGAGVNTYWRMETAIRQAESDLDSCIGCTGAVYAIRRPLFRPIPSDTTLDDVVVPMQIALAGYRILYDSQAQAFDPQPLDTRSETRRKGRTLAGNFQMLLRYPSWLLPWKNRLAWQLISHKYLRLAGPLILICILASNTCLLSHPFYCACFALQFLLYLLAAIGLALPSLRIRLVTIPAGFLFLNLMTLRGFLRYILAPPGGAWDSRTPGSTPPQSPSTLCP